MSFLNLTLTLLAFVAPLTGSSDSALNEVSAVTISHLRFALRKLPQPEQCDRFCRGVCALANGQVVVVEEASKHQLDFDLLAKTLENLKRKCTNPQSNLDDYLSGCIELMVEESQRDATERSPPQVKGKDTQSNGELAEGQQNGQFQGERSHNHANEAHQLGETGDKKQHVGHDRDRGEHVYCPIHDDPVVRSNPLQYILTKALGGKCQHPCRWPK